MYLVSSNKPALDHFSSFFYVERGSDHVQRICVFPIITAMPCSTIIYRFFGLLSILNQF